MNTPNDGGPAFPNDAVSWGMSLRAYFIAHAPMIPPPWFKPKTVPRPEPLWADPARTLCINEQELIDWSDMHSREHTLQWPVFWADQMIQQLNINTQKQNA